MILSSRLEIEEDILAKWHRRDRIISCLVMSRRHQ
jgi:hypothetical protein